jgi:glycosyltransferase involved in cell wall biosynthesis
MDKIVLVTNIPNHYRIPLFNALSNSLKGEEIQLKVIFGAAGYATRKNQVSFKDCQFDYTFLQVSGGPKGKIKYKGLLKELKNEKPDRIVVSGFNWATLKCLYYCKQKAIPLLLWNGSVEIGVVKTPWIKKLFRRVLIPHINHFIAYGSLAKKYLIELGAKAESVSAIGNTIDTTFFEQEVHAEHIKRTDPNRKHHLLYIGYLTPRKNVFPLLEVAEALTEIRKDFVLDIVGDGESLKALKEKAGQMNLTSHVEFHGFKQKAELPSYLAQADVFLFQTEGDIWGLVLNEAMISALPTLASDKAGASYDLIEEGNNGYKVNFHQTSSVVALIEELLNNPEKARKIGESAAKSINNEYSIIKVTERFKKALIA